MTLLHNIDLPTFHRHTVGFDRLFDELTRTFANSAGSRTDNYPPYNIVKLDETHYIIEVAVAGFDESELDVELKDSVLYVKGQKERKESTAEYLHRGVSSRSFERIFTLMPDIEVRAATVENGILAIALEHVIPEEKKPRKIALTFKK